MKRLRRITLISFIGLLLSFGLWWVSFWNFDYCLESPYRISLNHGSVTWSDWSAYEQDRKWPAGFRKIGYNGLTTLWKPHFFRSSGNLVATTVPIWMAVVVFGLLYYGLSVVGVGVGLLRQHHGRCRECGRRLSNTLLCCRGCQTPVSMMTVGRRALGQFALHGFVITVGAMVVSYFHFSATPAAGTTIGLTRGALAVRWGSNTRPGMSLAGYTGMKTVWLPNQTSSIAKAAPVPPPPPRGAPTAPGGPLAATVLLARTFLFPLWVPLLVFGCATWRLRFAPANLLRRRKKLGLCLRCGYDLRASRERCPECGTAFEMDRPRLQGGE